MSGGESGSGSSLLAIDENSSIIYNTTTSPTDTHSDMKGLAFTSGAILIPTVIFVFLVIVLIGFYIWRCYTQYQELKEAEKEEDEKNVKVPIAEPEDFPPVVPLTVTTSPSDDDIVLADRDNQNNVDHAAAQNLGEPDRQNSAAIDIP